MSEGSRSVKLQVFYALIVTVIFFNKYNRKEQYNLKHHVVFSHEMESRENSYFFFF